MKPMQLSASMTVEAELSGKPRRFKIEAYDGGKLPVKGFDMPVVVDLSGLQIPESIPILIDHVQSVDTTLGSTDSIINDGRTLVEAGSVTGNSPMALRVIAQHDSGHQWQASIKCIVDEDTLEVVASGRTVDVNGQTIPGPCYVARNSILKETSVLPIGAATRTTVNLAASAANTFEGAAIMSFDEWIASLGIDAATLTEENKAALTMAYDAMTNAAKPVESPAPVAAEDPPAPTEEEKDKMAVQAAADLTKSLRTTAANEGRRIAQINAMAVGHPLIAAKAIEAGWSSEKVELEVLKANQVRTRPTSFRGAESNLPQEQVLEASMCMVRKTRDYEKDYTPAVLQAAHSQFRRGVGLQQILMLSAAANGYRAAPGERISMGNLREVLAYACPDVRNRHLQAAVAFSTVSLPGILSNVANKELLTGYMEEDNAWSEISQKKSVPDFKQITSYRLLDDMEYEELGPAGTIKSGSITEESYTRQARTYAKLFTLERTQIINDDMSSFDDLRNRVGRGAAKKLAKVFWTAWVNNGSFFTSARTNYISGATTNLALDGVGLGLGVAQFRKMTSPSGDGTKRVGAGLRPEILLVPPELEAFAETLYRSTNIAAVKASDANIYANKYRPVVAWQLSDSAYTGYSTTAWYLLSAPSGYPTAVVSFLDGVETPTVEQVDLTADQLGILIRGYHDFGVDMAEYLGGLKSKGAA